MKSTTVLSMLLCVGTAVSVSRPAQAAIVVGSCIGTAKYTTIQDAVNAAPSGSLIKVCPGGYPEQVVIDKPLTLEGFICAGTEGAFIFPPAGGLVQNDYPYSAQLLVQNTTGVTITNLLVDGTNSAPCGINDLAGIDFHNASGTVSKVAVHNQSAALSCGGYGVAALVDNGQQAQKVTVQNSDFRNQSTIALYGSGSGLMLNTQNNFIAGPDKGQTVGIMYNYATGTIQGNTVVDEVFPQATSATPSLLHAMGIRCVLRDGDGYGEHGLKYAAGNCCGLRVF